jgi:hypothetical protein
MLAKLRLLPVCTSQAVKPFIPSEPFMYAKTIFPGATASSSIAALAAGCLLAASTQAAVIIPTKGGFSGFVNLGAGAVNVETNMISTIANGNIDVGSETIKDLNSGPGSESVGIPTVNFELSYTFEKTRTQVHIGNLMEDFLAFNMNTTAGVRQDIGNWGLIGASLQTTSLVTDVWQDPYATGVKRKDTERTNKGGRLFWQQIGSSGLELSYTASEVDIDKERSGDSLDFLTPAERKLLDRNGDVYTYEAMYEFKADGNRHLITPGLIYVDQDRDGDAMSYDETGVNINYIYQHSEKWSYVFNAGYADLSYDESNPIYGEKDGGERFSGSATVFYSAPFGLKKWALNGTVGWYQENHDIEFYDSSVGLFSIGMFRKF